ATNADSSSISIKNDRENVTLGGVVSAIREVTTRKKDVMAYVTIEDMKGSVTVIFFAEIYRKSFDLLHSDDPIIIKGVIDAGEEGVKIIAYEVSTLSDDMALSSCRAVRFKIDVSEKTPDDIDILYALLLKHRGKSDGFIHIMDDQSEVVIYLGNDFRLELSDSLTEEADRILGVGSTQYF
ncbi:MAG: OB-fold nucleic acid binding domain-containing protein, partial [Deltaproteobacteria bacterium]|nr:OB-fold nucleic acid binding domain-containing protein [Deltaproteobacteria bacterium]